MCTYNEKQKIVAILSKLPTNIIVNKKKLILLNILLLLSIDFHLWYRHVSLLATDGGDIPTTQAGLSINNSGTV